MPRRIEIDGKASELPSLNQNVGSPKPIVIGCLKRCALIHIDLYVLCRLLHPRRKLTSQWLQIVSSISASNNGEKAQGSHYCPYLMTNWSLCIVSMKTWRVLICRLKSYRPLLLRSAFCHPQFGPGLMIWQLPEPDDIQWLINIAPYSEVE